MLALFFWTLAVLRSIMFARESCDRAAGGRPIHSSCAVSGEKCAAARFFIFLYCNFIFLLHKYYTQNGIDFSDKMKTVSAKNRKRKILALTVSSWVVKLFLISKTHKKSLLNIISSTYCSIQYLNIVLPFSTNGSLFYVKCTQTQIPCMSECTWAPTIFLITKGITNLPLNSWLTD